MRTTPEERAALGRLIAEKLNRSRGPVAVYLPAKGVSAIAKAGGTFHNASADTALNDSLRAGLEPAIPCETIDADINDPVFATALAEKLDELMRSRTAPL